MPHGDFSDKSAFCGLLLGFVTVLLSILSPAAFTTPAGPIKPLFDGPISQDAALAMQFAGALLGGFIGPALFFVRWNVVNGPLVFLV